MNPCQQPSRRQANLHRSIVRHRWATLEEWVNNLEELSALSDDEIDYLASLAVNDDNPSM